MMQPQLQQPNIYTIEPASCGGYHIRDNGHIVRHGSRPVMWGTPIYALEYIWQDTLGDVVAPVISVDLDILEIPASLRHPTAPSLFKREETYVTAEYITRKCAAVECTYQLWNGSRENGAYVPAQPITYENMSRQEAYTELVMALDSGDESLNKWMQAYCNVCTREVEI